MGSKLFSTASAALNAVSYHSPAAAIFNFILWGYVLPKMPFSKL